MKTIEEKARAYDEAIEAARCIYNNMKEGSNFSGMEDLEVIFPELQESEDERIKNLIYCLIRDRSDNGKLLEHNGVSVEEALAWLERQKPSDAALEYLKENHSPSEVSDFQAAMNIAVAKAYDRGIADAIKQDPCRTCDHPTMSCINFPCEKKQCEHNSEEPHWVHHKVDLSGCSKEYIAAYYDGWNNCNMQHSQRQAEQKPAWSEEDEMLTLSIEQVMNCASLLNIVPEKIDKIKSWLKSIKDRVQPQPIWREEDEKNFKWLCRIIHSCTVRKGISLAEESELGNWINKWLNHAPQNTWKPSEKQMCYLKKVYESYYFCDAERGALESLYNDLQKLL